MASKIQEKIWKLHNYKQKKLLIWGLKHGYIAPYGDNLIEKLRTISYGGIPASIILLSDGMTNGYCYDRATLMSQAFLDNDDEDVQLVYAAIDSLRLNPKYEDRNKNPLFADHCIVERTTKDGQKLIYDTSAGLLYDKQLYWLMERPKVRKRNSKESIKSYIAEENDHYPEDIERDKYASPLILPMIESSYSRPTEMYAALGIELLQREIEHFKKEINYDAVCKEIDDDMKRMGIR